MKLLLIPIITTAFLNTLTASTVSDVLDNGDSHSSFSVQQSYYTHSKPETQIHGNTYVKLKKDKLTAKIDVNYRYSTNYDKQYVQLKELYARQEYETYLLSIGKVVKHWGELEGFNVTDVYNQKNYEADPFNKDDKVGNWSASVSSFSENHNVELGMKFYEDDQRLPRKHAAYIPVPNYHNKLKLSHSRMAPTVYGKYSFSTNDTVESDTSIIVQRGYDNKRYFSPNGRHGFVQNAYRANKYMVSSNVNYNDTSFKVEAAYTDVIDNKVVSDYQQVSVGVEKTIYDIIGVGVDVGLYGEYYNYKYKDKKLENQDMSEVYNNDVFLAMRVNFNDVGSTEIKAGVLVDLDTSEKVYKVQLKSRVKDKLVLKAEVLKIKNAKNSLLTTFKDTTRSNIDATYNF